MLGELVGTWRFEIWFAGIFSRTPDVSGIRVLKALFDDLRLEWTEVLDHSQVRGQGLVGFDPASDRFFSTSVYNVGSAPELLTGILDDAQPSITFYALAITPSAGEPPPAPASTLALLDHDHFTWSPGPGVARGVHAPAIGRRQGLAPRARAMHARGAGGDLRPTSATLPQRGSL